MKLFPLLVSLLISAVPVQAIETFEELDKACKASEETYNTCTKAAVFVGTAAWVHSLCELEAKGRLTKENLILTWDEVVEKSGWTPLSDDALEMALEKSPGCPIKPLP